MKTTRDDIRQWFKAGKKQKATHMIIVCDTFSYEDYPVYVSKSEDVHKVEEKYKDKNMQMIMEVYNLSMDINKQIGQGRVFNY